MDKQITVIVGTQWGDEGKGKITDFFASQNDYVVRFQGGNNAGHTVIVGNETYKLHLLPSGVISPDTVSIIGNGVVVNPKVLYSEIQQIKERGLNPKLLISQRAHVIMPYHIALDVAVDAFQGKLAAGSTKRGIMGVCADKMYRHGIRMGDLLEPEMFKEKLAKAYQFNIGLITKVFNAQFSDAMENIYHEYLGYGEKLREYIHDTELELHKAYKYGQKILFEGAQGMSLDPDHGMYPHGTSTNNVAGYSEVGSGVGFNDKKEVVGITKAYVSRVGNSPFITELKDEMGDKIRDKGGEYGTTTGRPRRVGWLDLVQVRQSVRTSGLTQIAMTKLDILAGFDEIKVCTAYKVNGKITDEMPASLSEMREAIPLYQTLAGWKDLTTEDVENIKIKGYDYLPQTMKDYIEFVEQQVGCAVKIISFGPKRSETIIR